MLQTNHLETFTPLQDSGSGLDLAYYYAVLKKRVFFFLIPAVLVFAVGAVVAFVRPSIYQSQGTILIEAPQIPVELVRPTVSATAAARIQVIEQRVMTRDNLLAVANKFRVFADHRNWYGALEPLTGSDVLDEMRKQTQIKPVALDVPNQRNTLATIAFTVSFEHTRPEIATRVAGELVTLILGEDARNRTNRASETTKFLDRETKRLEGERDKIDFQIAEVKRKTGGDTASQKLQSDLASLRTDLEQKSTIYAPSHPTMKALQRQIAILEKTAAKPADAQAPLDVLQRQQVSIQKSLDEISDKLTIARRGETLERDQQSERLEVIEQPIVPTKPIKGSRLKVLLGSIGAAFASGVGAIFVAETLDRTIRGTSDLVRIVDPSSIVNIPYIATAAENRRKKRMVRWIMLMLVMLLLGGLAAVHFLWMPLDLLWDKVMVRLQTG